MYQKIAKEVETAYGRLRGVVSQTPLILHQALSHKFAANIYLKREDLQPVRSYKLRGAYNRMSNLPPADRRRGIVCSSAGNHAQGVAFGCQRLKIKGHIFMPQNTPRQKISRVEHFGSGRIVLHLTGDSYDEANRAAKEFSRRRRLTFIHPFDDPQVIAGQGTMAIEIAEQLKRPPDLLLAPIGGGGLAAGVGSYFKFRHPRTKVYGVEPAGAASMLAACQAGRPVKLATLDKFIDGAAVRQAGRITYKLVKATLAGIFTIPEGRVASEMIKLYQDDGIVTEPAGALAVAGLARLGRRLKGRTAVAIVSGGNNDMSRYQEIVERSLIFQGLKHYFIIEFSQRPGALRRYINQALGPRDDITLFEYTKKNNKETGPALVGIELSRKQDLEPLLERMRRLDIKYELLLPTGPLFRFLV